MEEQGIESHFVRTMKFMELYIEQKTDLFLQHYVFEPVDFLIRQILFLSVIVTLLAAGTVVLVIGVILFIATLAPLWSALLISGSAILGICGIIGYFLLSKKIVLKTSTTSEMVKNEAL